MKKKQGNTRYDIEDNQIKLHLTIDIIDGFCQYALSENENIKPSCLVQLRDVVDRIDIESYDFSSEMVERLEFCKAVVHTKIDHKIKNRGLIINYVMGASGNKFPTVNTSKYVELSNEDVNFIENKIIPKYAENLYVFKHVNSIKDLSMNVLLSDPQHIDENVTKLKDELDMAHKELSKYSVNDDKDELGLDDDVRRMKLAECIKDIQEPTHVLKTGMRMFNDLIKGGFEPARVYSLFGMPGDGKSLTLKDLAIQILKYNKGYKCRDKTKKPVILYLSMENRIQEDMQLFMNMIGYNINIRDKKYSVDYISDIWENSVFNDKDGIRFVFVYKSVYSVNTQYIRDKIDQLANMGYETIAVIQDYIKRILPSIRANDDERLKLGTITNEFRAIAIDYQLAFITASQLNREGSKEIILNREKGKYDAAMSSIDSFYIGESSLINENLDYSIFIVPFWVNDDRSKKYMGFKAVKRRFGGTTNSNKFYQPYCDDCLVKLQEDVNGKTAGVLLLNGTIHDSFSNNTNNYISKDAVNKEQKMEDMKNLTSMGFSGGLYNYNTNNMIEVIDEFNSETMPESIRKERVIAYLKSIGMKENEYNKVLESHYN